MNYLLETIPKLPQLTRSVVISQTESLIAAALHNESVALLKFSNGKLLMLGYVWLNAKREVVAEADDEVPRVGTVDCSSSSITTVVQSIVIPNYFLNQELVVGFVNCDRIEK